MKILGKIIESIELRKHRKKIKEVRYFHPKNEPFPAGGHPFHKGAYFSECYRNQKSFKEYNNQYYIDKHFNLIRISEGMHDIQYNLPDYSGGIIVFSTDVNSVQLSNSKLKNWIKQKLKTMKQRLFSKPMITKLLQNHNKDFPDKDDPNRVGSFSIGNFFSGRYIDDHNNVYNENSTSIELNGITSDALFVIAEEIANEFYQETVLVKDLNKNKIFLVDGK